MTSRSLKIALAVSVALNVFAAAAVGAVWVARDKIEHRVAEAHKQGRREPVWDVIERMDPAVRRVWCAWCVRWSFRACARRCSAPRPMWLRQA